MDSMKMLLLLIVLCHDSSLAQAASPFRFLNPYSWFASSANPTPAQIVTPAVNSTQGTGNANTLAKRVWMDQNSSHSSTTIPPHEAITVKHEKQEKLDLVPTPLQIESLEIRDSDATRAQVLVPTRVAPLLSPIHSVRRFGLIRETDGQEGREEIELQTTTVTASAEVTVSREESDRTSETESVTEDVKTRTQPTPPLLSSTEKVIPASTLSPVTASTSEPDTAAPIVKLQESHAPHEGESLNSVPAATAIPNTPLMVTVTERMISEPERSTSPSPVYVPSSPQREKHAAFLFDDDFVRYLNRHYYSSPIFNSVVGRGLH